jgi:serine/threonine protein kinase
MRSSTHLSGQTVNCPHCRNPFRMPGGVEDSGPVSMKSEVPSGKRKEETQAFWKCERCGRRGKARASLLGQKITCQCGAMVRTSLEEIQTEKVHMESPDEKLPSLGPDIPPSVQDDPTYDETMISTELRELVPGFEIIATLGSRGMGTVYKARHILSNVLVALKVLSPQLAGNPEFVSRFIQEGNTTIALRHPNLAGAIECGESGGNYYIALEFIDGQPLNTRIKSGSLPENDALNIVRQIAEAMHYAWENNVIHRDIKPANIMIDQSGVPKLCDLGLCRHVETDSKLTQPGAVYCTPSYASPEQSKDATQVDTRSDIYSLGITLYELLTGKTPFDGRSATEIFVKHASEEPKAANTRNRKVSDAANDLVMWMIQKDPDKRPQTARQVAQRIELILRDSDPGRLPSRGADAGVNLDQIRPPKTFWLEKPAVKAVLVILAAVGLAVGLAVLLSLFK